jgi:flagellar biosynthesis/type III secretory pathway M-ring protein FliF/YscJ
LEVAVALAVLAALVAYVVTRPLLRARREEGDDGDRRALEAAKEAKYREIRDAELDFRMGKLSEEDYRATDRELRAQAIAILRRLDELGAGGR